MPVSGAGRWVSHHSTHPTGSRVGWVEWCETHRPARGAGTPHSRIGDGVAAWARWVSHHSTHPTNSVRGTYFTLALSPYRGGRTRMPRYRRNYVPGGTYFFTVVTFGRRPLFAQERARH